MGATQLIPPHGGHLVDRTGAGQEPTKPAISIQLSQQEQCDLEMIAIGAMSPLEGFMTEADFHSVCDNVTLTDGTIWPIPITCAVHQATAVKIGIGDRVALSDDANRLLGYLTVTEKYKCDKKKQTLKVFLTEDAAHPGVKVIMDSGDICLAGKIDVATARHEPMFAEHRLGPAQTRAEFQQRNWKTVAAFQTRNPIHRAHE